MFTVHSSRAIELILVFIIHIFNFDDVSCIHEIHTFRREILMYIVIFQYTQNWYCMRDGDILLAVEVTSILISFIEIMVRISSKNKMKIASF